MKQFKIYLYVLIALCSISCSRKSVPTNQYRPAAITVQSDCDSAVQAAIEIVRNMLIQPGSADSCELLPVVVNLTDRLNAAQKKVVALEEQIRQTPTAPVTVFTGKVKNSFNDIQKNNNNTTEIYKLKNSLLARDSFIAQLQAENASLGGRLKDKTKVVAKQGSAIGDGNKIDNRKKDRFWLGVLVTLGVLYSIKTLFTLLKRYFPIISFIQKFLP